MMAIRTRGRALGSAGKGEWDVDLGKEGRVGEEVGEGMVVEIGMVGDRSVARAVSVRLTERIGAGVSSRAK